MHGGGIEIQLKKNTIYALRYTAMSYAQLSLHVCLFVGLGAGNARVTDVQPRNIG